MIRGLFGLIRGGDNRVFRNNSGYKNGGTSAVRARAIRLRVT